jgi:hypothetical protein
MRFGKHARTRTETPILRNSIPCFPGIGSVPGREDCKKKGGENMDNGSIVAQTFACPHCGNRDMDSLVMDDQDICTCHKCGTVYDPQKGGKTACQNNRNCAL